MQGVAVPHSATAGAGLAHSIKSNDYACVSFKSLFILEQQSRSARGKVRRWIKPARLQGNL
jgi:hypothetical protein